jgi:predicted ArsR family transcriptional regulator
MPDPKRTVTLTDPRALRALAHPTRLKLVGLLRREGPLTATQAGALLGEVPASASFHLRQLAKYGLVEEASGGRGRERPWQATASFTSWSAVGADPAMAAADQMLSTVVVERYMEQVLRWLDERADEPIEWQDAALFGDMPLYVTAEELKGVRDQLLAVVAPYLERASDASARPDGSRMVTLIQLAFPTAELDAR